MATSYPIRPRGPPSDVGSEMPVVSLPPLEELTELPRTYGELLTSTALPRCFRAYAVKLGMHPRTPLRHFHALPECDLMDTLQEIVDEGG